MKQFNSLLAVAALALSFGSMAQADTVIDTGVPSVTGLTVLDSGNWLAAEFTTTQDWVLNSVQGYLTGFDSNQTGNTFNVAIYDSNPANLSAAPNPTYTYQEVSGQAQFNGVDNSLNGLTGLAYYLPAGTYWVAFEVAGSQNFEGTMASGTANPLQPAAWYDGMSTKGYIAQASGSLDLGVQITGTSAVPVPASVWLFASALMGFAGFRKSNKA